MLSIETIIYELRNHRVTENKIREVETAYQIACDIHKNQTRESGEPYIIHPLNVANNVLKMEIYDPDTISAALLHDTIEDAVEDFTKEDIAKLINPEVAELVDGVTKMRRMNFDSKNDQNNANTRKIINGLTKDVRIIFIKLADRLHNMETLQYKKPEKQLSNAKETMALFVPIALGLGAYRIKNELEDLSLKYIDPEEYKRILEGRTKIEEKELPYLKEMAHNIIIKLDNKKIKNQVIFRNQTINTLYKKIKKGYELENIYDTCYFKVLVDEIEDCYYTLYLIHSLYTPIPGRFKDYIGAPRTNFYQSLHTTIADSNGKLKKIKMRTFDMDKIAGFGIPSYWNLSEDRGRKTIKGTQEMINNNLQIGKQLREIDEAAKDDTEFYEDVFSDVLTPNHIYVNTSAGVIVELPKHSTAIDFICQAYPEQLDQVTGVVVNGKEVSLNKELKNNDRVEIKTNGKVNQENWEAYATTKKAQQKIKRLKEQKQGK